MSAAPSAWSQYPQQRQQQQPPQLLQQQQQQQQEQQAPTALQQPTEFSGYVTRFIPAHKKKAYCLGWNCKGDRIAAGSSDYTIKVFPSSTFYRDGRKEAEADLKGHTGNVDALVWHPTNPDQLVSVSGVDKSVRLWDLRSPKSGTMLSAGAATTCLCWVGQEGREVVAGSRDAPVQLIDVRKSRSVKTHKMSYEVNDVKSVSKGGKEVLLAATSSGSVLVLLHPTMECVMTLQPHTANCYCLAVDKQHKYLATSGQDAVVTLWQLDELACIHSFIHMDQPVKHMGFSHDAKYLAFGTEDNNLEIVSVPSGAPVVQVPTLSSYPIDGIAWNPSSPVVAYLTDVREQSMPMVGSGLFLYSPQGTEPQAVARK